MTPTPFFVLVDPDAQGLETLVHAFEREGCRIAGTSDPAAAPEMIRANRAHVVVIAVRPERAERSMLDLISGLHIHPDTKNLPIIALGPVALRAPALAAGAFDYLNTPLYLRDAISISRLVLLMRQAAATQTAPLRIQAPLRHFQGLFYMVRAMALTGRSGVLEMLRAPRKGEVRFCDGVVTTAQIGSLQGFPALHQLLLWNEATVALTLRDVPARSQFSLDAADIVGECERFLRDYEHAAADIGPPGMVFAVGAGGPGTARAVPGQVGPVARLFDGQRTLADVIEESPFRIFDTLRVVKQLLDGNLLVPKGEATSAPARARTQTASQGSRSTPAGIGAVPDRRADEGDRRKASRSHRVGGGATPPPRAAGVPIPLVAKKTPGLGIVAGEIAPRARAAARSDARADLVPPAAREPSVQVSPQIKPDAKPDAPRLSLDMPIPVPLVATKSAAKSGGRPTKTPLPKHAPSTSPAAKTVVKAAGKTPLPVAAAAGVPAATVRASRSKRHAAVTPTSAFDAIDNDFFAREADLYKPEAVESFDDLDGAASPHARRGLSEPGRRPRSPERK